MSPLSRALLAAAALVAWGGTAVQVAGIEEIPYPRGLAAAVDLAWVGSPAGFGALTALYAAAIALHSARVRPVAAGLAAFALMALIAHVEFCLYPTDGEHHGKLLPINAVLAASLGLWWRGERAAREAACGIVAGSYVFAGAIKLWLGGPLWFARSDLPLLAAERSVGALPPLAAARLALAEQPALAGAGSLAVLALELGAVAFLWPRARRPWAAVMIASHLLIGLFLGYPYVDWILALAALGLAQRGDD